MSSPRCTSDGWNWSQNDWGSNALDQYVEPSGVNFHRLLPNYFYRSGGVVRIQSRYQSQIIVCTSRYQEHPRYRNRIFHVQFHFHSIIIIFIFFFLSIIELSTDSVTHRNPMRMLIASNCYQMTTTIIICRMLVKDTI